MTSKILDNSNPTVHATLSQAHAEKPVSQSALLANVWKTSNDDPQEQDSDMEWVKSAVSQEDTGKPLAFTENTEREDIDELEVFDLLRSITDPEHPLTLEQLAVVSPSQIHVSNKQGGERILIEFTPTIPHCSMATLIGLTLRVRLLRSLPPKYKVDIRIKEGMHQSENAVNKQLNDKERVQAALENAHLLGVVEGCLSSADNRGNAGGGVLVA